MSDFWVSLISGIVGGLVVAVLIGLVGFLARRSRGTEGPDARPRTVGQAIRRPTAAMIGLVSFVAALVVGSIVFVVMASSPPAATPPTSMPGTPLTTSPDDGAGIDTTAGWGPERDLFSVDSRPAHVTLNSLVDNPVYGDERNFVQIKPAGESSEEYTESLIAVPGDTYTVFVYFNNDADPDSGIVSAGTRVRAQMPATATGAALLYVMMSSDNAAPAEIWDGASLLLDDPTEQFGLSFVSGSATIHSDGAVDGRTVSDDLFREGVLIGCDDLDGRLPPDIRCSGYVTFDITVHQPDFAIEAGARIKNSGDGFGASVDVGDHEVVEVRVVYTNVGSTRQDDVTLTVSLPPGFRYVDGSASIANSVTGGEYSSTIDGITETGINVGSYTPEGNVYVKFDVFVDDPFADGSESAWLTVDDFARADTGNGSKSAGLRFVRIR